MPWHPSLTLGRQDHVTEYSKMTGMAHWSSRGKDANRSFRHPSDFPSDIYSRWNAGRIVQYFHKGSFKIIAVYQIFFNLDSYLPVCPPLSCKSTMQCKWDITQRKRQLNSEQNRKNIVALPTQTTSNPSDVSFRPPSTHLPTLRYFWKHSLSFRLASAIASFSKMHNGKPETYPSRRTLQCFRCMFFFYTPS